MKYNRELLAADRRDELEKISGIVLELRKHAAMLERTADETPMYDRAATLLTGQVKQFLNELAGLDME